MDESYRINLKGAMYTKTKIFNLALSALLLTKQVADADSDTSTECRTLNLHWDTALFTTLQDLNLDGTSSQMNLELEATDPNTLWKYAYKYPTKCAYFRRIQSGFRKDTRSTQIPMRTGMIGSSKVIFVTNHRQSASSFLQIFQYLR